MTPAVKHPSPSITLCLRRYVYISVRHPAREIQEEVNSRVNSDQSSRWRNKLVAPHTWNHISLRRCIVPPELLHFTFWAVKSTWRIYGPAYKKFTQCCCFCSSAALHRQAGSVYKICRCQSQLRSNNMDNLAEVYGERWGKDHWSRAMTQKWQ